MMSTSEWCAKHPFAGQNTPHQCILSYVKNKNKTHIRFQMFWDFENPEFESPLYVLCHVSVNDPETNGVSEQDEDNQEELVNLNKITCCVDTSIITFSAK